MNAILNGQPPITPNAQSSRKWYEIKNECDSAADVFIFDSIGKDPWSDAGIEAKAFIDELAKIPLNKPINLRINCPGGSVWDGIPIHNAISQRGNVTTSIEGVALSTGSWIGLKASKVRMASNSLMMIHKSSSMFYGNSKDAEQMKERLEKHDKIIAGMYCDKCKEDEEEMLELMDKETWFTAQEALDMGLIDEITPAITINNNFDLSGFKRVPESLAQAQKGTPNNNTPKERKTMDKAKVIALLKSRGIAVSDDASEEILLGHLAKLGIDPTNSELKITQDNAEASKLIQQIHAEREELKKQVENIKRERISNRIEQFINEARITVDQKDKWIKASMENEEVLDMLSKLPQNLPGLPPVGIETISPDIRNVVKNMGKRQDPSKPEMCRDIAIQNAVMFRENRDKLIGVWNTNTIDSALQQTVILNNSMLAFSKKLMMLNAFSTVFRNVVLQGAGTVTVPYYALETASSTNFSSSYSAGNTTSDKKVITINKRKYQGFAFTGDEWNRQPWLNIATQAELKANKLAYDVIIDILSVVTNVNYSTAVFTGAAGTFDDDDVVDIRAACVAADWPEMGRSLILDDAYYANLLKQSNIKNAMAAGSDSALRAGATGRLFGFDLYEFPSMPTNSENLVGFASFVSGILVATSPIAPPPGVRSLINYQVVTDPATGISFEYRYWGTPASDTDTEIIECNYGYAAGEAAAVKRLTSA